MHFNILSFQSFALYDANDSFVHGRLIQKHACNFARGHIQHTYSNNSFVFKYPQQIAIASYATLLLYTSEFPILSQMTLKTH